MRLTFVTNVILKLMCSTKSKKLGHGSISYQDAVYTLNSLQSNAEIIAEIRKERETWCKKNVPCMIDYIQRSGLTMEDIVKLPVIHISGTKGKGSTSAFCESILRHRGYKTGFFSSPHLVKVTERFRINGQPLSDDEFSSYFFDVYNKLVSTKNDLKERQMPTYFAFLTVMAFNVFVKENVDVAVMEVGIGGEYDSTNVVPSPVVCGVTSLGIDHVEILGNTIDQIAWNKAGIFKKGVPAVFVDQPPEAETVILERSKEIGAPVYRVPALEGFCVKGQQLSLGIEGCMQDLNASLALQLCQVFVDRTNKKQDYLYDVTSVRSTSEIPVLPTYTLTPPIVKGLAECKWPGRNQRVFHPGLTYYLDGAHTKESMEQCVQWFSEKSKKEAEDIKGRVCKILIFNSTRERNVSYFLSILKSIHFDGVVFCPNLAFSGPTSNTPDQSSVCATKEKQLKASKYNQIIWESLCRYCIDGECINNSQNCTVVTNGEAKKLDSCLAINNKIPEHIVSEPLVNCVDSETTCDSSLPPPKKCQNPLKRPDSTVGNGDTAQENSCPVTASYAFPCILEALHWATQNRDPNLQIDTQTDTDLYSIPDNLRGAAHIQILVTGSLHLVGGVLGFVSPNVYH